MRLSAGEGVLVLGGCMHPNLHVRWEPPATTCTSVQPRSPAPQGLGWNFAPPHGESQRQVEQRMTQYLVQQVLPHARPDAPAIVVSHGEAGHGGSGVVGWLPLQFESRRERWIQPAVLPHVAGRRYHCHAITCESQLVCRHGDQELHAWRPPLPVSPPNLLVLVLVLLSGLATCVTCGPDAAP